MFSLQSPFAVPTHACQKPLTTNSTLDRSGGAGAAGKCTNNVVRVAPRPKNPSQSNNSGGHNVRQNHFANNASGTGGGGYMPNLFATDYFQQQQQQQQQPVTRVNNDNGRSSGGNGMNTNAINFSAYQQPNYPQYAHTAPRNRSSSGVRGGADVGTSPRNANIPGGHKVINGQSGDKINSGASFMDHCSGGGGGGKSLLPNPFLISRAGQSKGKLPVSASTTGRSQHHQQQQAQPRDAKSDASEGANKKFNSLKSSLTGLRKTPPFYYSMRSGGNEGQNPGQKSSGKSCKRHQSFNQPKSDGFFEEATGEFYYEGGEQQHTLYYEEQPLYENLTDSIQIHELSTSSNAAHKPQGELINDQKQQQQLKTHQKPLKQIHQHRHHHSGGGGGEKMKKAHHKSCDMIERSSIYRSDSGISNSSYECITPVPAPRGANGELVVVGAAGHEASVGAGTASRKSKKKMPVYMNLACHLATTTAAGNSDAVATDCVDGIQRPPAGAAGLMANTNPAEVCVPNLNLIIYD